MMEKRTPVSYNSDLEHLLKYIDYVMAANKYTELIIDFIYQMYDPFKSNNSLLQSLYLTVNTSLSNTVMMLPQVLCTRNRWQHLCHHVTT